MQRQLSNPRWNRIVIGLTLAAMATLHGVERLSADEPGLAALAAPGPISLPKVPWDLESRPWRGSLERVPSGEPPLPPANLSLPARLIPSEFSRQARFRPPLDLAPVAAEIDSLRPRPPSLPVVAKIMVPGSDPERIAALPPLARPVSEVPDAAVDVTSEQTRQWLLSPLTGLRFEPVPFTRLSIPDPFEHLKGLQVRGSATDDLLEAIPTLPAPMVRR